MDDIDTNTDDTKINEDDILDSMLVDSGQEVLPKSNYEGDTSPSSYVLQDANISKEQRVDRWKNRRAMAWIALISIIVTMILLLTLSASGGLSVLYIEGLTGIIIGFYSIMGTILAAYFGTTTYYHIKGGK